MDGVSISLDEVKTNSPAELYQIGGGSARGSGTAYITATGDFARAFPTPREFIYHYVCRNTDVKCVGSSLSSLWTEAYSEYSGDSERLTTETGKVTVLIKEAETGPTRRVVDATIQRFTLELEKRTVTGFYGSASASSGAPDYYYIAEP